MNQTERRLFLIQSLLNEQPGRRQIGIPADPDGQRQLLRGLLNLRPPQPCSSEFLRVQDAYLHSRLACAEQMAQQRHPEPTGRAKITPAFNLPCRYVLHTVGPIVSGHLTPRDCALLASCYRACLQLAAQNGLESVAFCCISTGEFCFPNQKAAEIAVGTVRDFLRSKTSVKKVIFNVFKDMDKTIYERLLCTDADFAQSAG